MVLKLMHLDKIVLVNSDIHPLSANVSSKVYFTLHSTTMSSPLIRSCDTEAGRKPLVWDNLLSSVSTLPPCLRLAPGIIIRIWQVEPKPPDKLLFTWGVYFSSLACIGRKIGHHHYFSANTVVFGLNGSLYTASDSTSVEEVKPIVTEDPSAISYSKYNILRMWSLQRTIVKQGAANDQLRSQIENWDLRPPPRDQLMYRTGRHFLGLVEANPRNYTDERRRRKAALARKEALKLKLDHLRDEKRKLEAEVGQLLKDVVEEKITVEKMRSAQRKQASTLEEESLILDDLFVRSDGIGEELASEKHFLAVRRRQLISDLCQVYPITQDEKFTYICGLPLRHAESLSGLDEVKLAVALGHVAHVTFMTSYFLNLPLRHPIEYEGSKSRMLDQLREGIVKEKDREFPLYTKSRDRQLFQYGVYLLNRDIGQLRHFAGLRTSDLGAILPNLDEVLMLRFSTLGNAPGFFYEPGRRPSSQESVSICGYSVPRVFSASGRYHTASESSLLSNIGRPGSLSRLSLDSHRGTRASSDPGDRGSPVPSCVSGNSPRDLDVLVEGSGSDMIFTHHQNLEKGTSRITGNPQPFLSGNDPSNLVVGVESLVMDTGFSRNPKKKVSSGEGNSPELSRKIESSDSPGNANALEDCCGRSTGVVLQPNPGKTENGPECGPGNMIADSDYTKDCPCDIYKLSGRHDGNKNLFGDSNPGTTGCNKESVCVVSSRSEGIPQDPRTLTEAGSASLHSSVKTSILIPVRLKCESNKVGATMTQASLNPFDCDEDITENCGTMRLQTSSGHASLEHGDTTSKHQPILKAEIVEVELVYGEQGNLSEGLEVGLSNANVDKDFGLFRSGLGPHLSHTQNNGTELMPSDQSGVEISYVVIVGGNPFVDEGEMIRDSQSRQSGASIVLATEPCRTFADGSDIKGANLAIRNSDQVLEGERDHCNRIDQKDPVLKVGGYEKIADSLAADARNPFFEREELKNSKTSKTGDCDSARPDSNRAYSSDLPNLGLNCTDQNFSKSGRNGFSPDSVASACIENAPSGSIQQVEIRNLETRYKPLGGPCDEPIHTFANDNSRIPSCGTGIGRTDKMVCEKNSESGLDWDTNEPNGAGSVRKGSFSEEDNCGLDASLFDINSRVEALASSFSVKFGFGAYP